MEIHIPQTVFKFHILSTQTSKPTTNTFSVGGEVQQELRDKIGQQFRQASPWRSPGRSRPCQPQG